MQIRIGSKVFMDMDLNLYRFSRRGCAPNRVTQICIYLFEV
jgi:hypothetical protein